MPDGPVLSEEGIIFKHSNMFEEEERGKNRGILVDSQKIAQILDIYLSFSVFVIANNGYLSELFVSL